MTAACSSSSVTDTNGSAVRYELISYKGNALPAVSVQNATQKTEILSGSVTLLPNARFADSTFYRVTINGIISRDTAVFVGSYAQSGNNYTFTQSPINPRFVIENPYIMVMNGNNLIYSDFLYLKR